MNESEVIREMLGNPPQEPRTIAVIGLSDNPDKPSHYVPAYMQEHGYRILPVNPLIESTLGERAFPSLSELPLKPDIVNVFRLPKFIPAIVEEMITLGLKNIWVQMGIVNLEAARRAEEAGINVVMDRCIMIDHGRMGLDEPAFLSEIQGHTIEIDEDSAYCDFTPAAALRLFGF